MRISSKGRNALTAMIYIGHQCRVGEYVSVSQVSETFGMSKLYLDQIFLQLRRGGGLLRAVKGAQGKYTLAKAANLITVYDILSMFESSIFEDTETTVAEEYPEIEEVMQSQVFIPANHLLADFFENITLEQLVRDMDIQKEDEFMFYI